MYESEIQSLCDEQWLKAYERTMAITISSDETLESSESSENTDKSLHDESSEEMCITKEEKAFMMRLEEEGEINLDGFEEYQTETTLTRAEESRQFCQNLFYPQESHPLLACPEEEFEAARRAYYKTSKRPVVKLPRAQDSLSQKLFDALRNYPIDLVKEEYWVKGESALEIRFVIENKVKVTKILNRHTGKPQRFNLPALATALLDYYPEFSKKKFSKVNVRFLDFGSHLIYASGIIVETGSDSQSLSKYMFLYMMALLQGICDNNLVIEERLCHNIVAIATLNFPLCLNVLKYHFPAAREKDRFPGLIITVEDIDQYAESMAYHADDVYATDTVVTTTGYSDDEDDSDLIALVNGDYKVSSASDESDQERNAILEEYGSSFTHGKKKGEKAGTFLVFKDKVIPAGCTPLDRLKVSFCKLYPVFEKCRATEANLAFERTLARKRYPLFQL